LVGNKNIGIPFFALQGGKDQGHLILVFAVFYQCSLTYSIGVVALGLPALSIKRLLPDKQKNLLPYCIDIIRGNLILIIKCIGLNVRFSQVHGLFYLVFPKFTDSQRLVVKTRIQGSLFRLTTGSQQEQQTETSQIEFTHTNSHIRLQNYIFSSNFGDGFENLEKKGLNGP